MPFELTMQQGQNLSPRKDSIQGKHLDKVINLSLST